MLARFERILIHRRRVGHAAEYGRIGTHRGALSHDRTTTIGFFLRLFGLSPESGIAGFPDGPPTKCAPDAVLSGSHCIDEFEASVWRIPAPTGVKKGLVKKIRQGKASNEACQAAVAGTPDPGPDNGTTDCNTSLNGAATTGTRSGCVSNDGAFDMVGNLAEWTAEWAAPSAGCGSWNVATNDKQCFGGAGTTGEPAVLVRGGSYDVDSGASAGPLTVRTFPPSYDGNFIGFRRIR